MKTLRTNFVTHTMINCLQPNYLPLNPEKYGWQKLDELDELDDAHENVFTNCNAYDAADGESSDDDWPISDDKRVIRAKINCSSIFILYFFVYWTSLFKLLIYLPL